jgi:hypothetical protein
VEQFEKVYKEVESKYQRGEKALKADYESLQKVRKILVDEKRHIRFGDWNAFDIEVHGTIFRVELSICLEQTSHSLNMELDLQSLLMLHVHCCTHWLRPRDPPPPPPIPLH